MSGRFRVNWKIMMVVTCVIGLPFLVIGWFLSNGIPMFTITAPQAFDRFFEDSEISDLSGGGSTWLDYDIDLRFKSNKPVAFKKKDEYTPGDSVVKATDEFLRLYPDDADSFLDTSELVYLSHKKHSKDIYCVYNKRTKICFFHAQD